MTSALSGIQVWDGLDRYNTLNPVAICAYDQSAGGYVPININKLDNQSTVASNSTPNSGIRTLATDNIYRSSYEIQNLGTGILYLKKGTGVGPNSYNLILKGGAAPYDGLGAYYEDTSWKGAVSISGQAGTSGIYIFTELS